MIWIVFAIVTACVIVAVARPFMRGAGPAPGAAPELEAYRLQLAELSREEERGAIAKEDAERTRTEISRRLLKAGRQTGAAALPGGRALVKANIAFVALAGAIAIGPVGLYALFGSPGLADQPLEARLSAPPSEQSIATQIANVERRLREKPDDAAGWTVIAPVYFKMGQFDKAANAYRRAIALGGPDEDKLLGLLEALSFAQDGVIPPEAKPVLDAALARNPKSLRGRFWLAVLASQDGRKADAERTYREMLSEDTPESWKGVVQKQLAALAEPQGRTSESAQKSAQESAQASPAAPQAGQDAVVLGMVGRLAARLKENGADLDGWLMLIRSYAVLKDPAKEQEAVDFARKQFASNPQALERIEALTNELGGAAAGGNSGVAAGKAPEAGKAQEEAGKAPGDEGGTIRGMVDRLAGRLKENGADLDGWLRLIRSYAVLKEPAKAQEALDSARKQFASGAQALEQIGSLAKDLGLEPSAGAQAPAAEASSAQASSGAQAPAAASQEGHQEGHDPTIDGMVERLASRLKQDGRDLSGWLMLIRSYAVLQETAKAQEAAASARGQFASEPEALGKIDSLTRGLGLKPGDGKGE